MKKISIITPSYNQGSFIKETINSVLSQNYPNLEYWIIDGGSTDETVSILKSYGDKINWVSQKDHGQTHAINKGLKKVTGDILAYLNSDDILLPEALKKVGEYFENHPDCNWLTGDCLVIDEKGNPSKGGWLVRAYKRFLLAIYSTKILRIADNMIPQPSTFWSRQAFEKIGNFNEKLNYVMDYDYWLRLDQFYKPHDLKFAISGFRSQPDSKSETSRDKLMKEGDKVLRSHGATKSDLFFHHVHSAVVRFIYKLIKV